MPAEKRSCCAALLGFRLPENFRQPYLARSITEFWRRWHVTLSTWLRDYLYIPLGGNRGTALGTYRNVMITMLLGGLWHGASWNFVIWGGLHGLMLAAHRRWRRPAGAGDGSAMRQALCRLGTFQLVCFAWIFFRCSTSAQAFGMLGQIAGIGRGGESWLAVLSALVASPLLLTVYALAVRGHRLALEWHPRSAIQELVWGALAGAFFVALSLLAPPGARFIYFQF